MDMTRKGRWALQNSPATNPSQVCKSVDSGVGSLEEEEDSPQVMTSAPAENSAATELLQNGDGDAQRFNFVYLGFAVLDRRYTQSMLPWVISEVRRRKERYDIKLKVEGSSVKALNVVDGTTTFQHGVQRITRCAKSLDKKCFAYLVKSNENTSSCFCYVFEALDNLSVPGFIHCIKETVKGSADVEKPRRKLTSFENTSSDAPNTVMVSFPLQYVGKVIVSHRQAPPTLIDDSVERFKSQSRQATLESELQQSQQIQESYLSSNTTRHSPEGQVKQRATKATSLDGADIIIGECDSQNLSPPDLHKDVRPRSCSDGDEKIYTSVKKERSGTTLSDNSPQTKHARTETIGENRSVVLQISPFNILVVGHGNTILMEKRLREISFCQQGSKNSEHFGFICREQRTTGYVCYVFKGEAENLVDSVMRSLKQAFHAAWQASGTTNVCESCPLHHLHILCTQLENCPPAHQHEVIQKELVLLSEEEMILFTERYKMESSMADISEKVEVTMAILRSVYEKRQKLHTHSYSCQGKVDKQAGILQKAKQFANSIGNFRNKRGRSKSTLREDSIGENSQSDEAKTSSLRGRSHTIDTLGSGLPPLHNEEKSPKTHPKLRRNFPRNRSTDSLPESNDPSPPNTPTKPVQQIHRKLSRQHSYRQNIFNSVVTPSKRNSIAQDKEKLGSWSEMVGRKRSSSELRALWRKSILEQILLIRMDKENKTLDDIQRSVELKRLKLAYEGPSCTECACSTWEKLLDSKETHIDPFLLQKAIQAGVPMARRGDVWIFLASHYTGRTDLNSLEPKGNYSQAREGQSLHQHSIFIDLGRTFPGHPYFTSQFGPGQLSLFNVLKAYSILDTDVGYCQGLSFVAGILLMHMGECQAFDTMQHLMYNLNLRKLYKSDMQELQIQFYMLSRLLHDFHPELYEFLEELDITPTLYSAGWFLTLFASMFPVGFVVRVMDMILLQGMCVVFKVMLVLLGRCKEGIMASDGFENAVEYIKTMVPKYGFENLESIVKDVLDLDVSKQLESYLIEYNVLREEDLSLASIEEFEHQRAKKLEIENITLSKHLQELTEQLTSARKTIQSLEATISTMQINQSNLSAHIHCLKAENETLKGTNKSSAASERKLQRSNSIDAPDVPNSPQSNVTDENTDSFEHIGCNDLTDDEAGSLDRDSPADDVNEKHVDLAVSR